MTFSTQHRSSSWFAVALRILGIAFVLGMGGATVIAGEATTVEVVEIVETEEDDLLPAGAMVLGVAPALAEPCPADELIDHDQTPATRPPVPPPRH